MTRSSAATLKLRRPRITDIPRLVEIERAAFAAGYYREHRLTAADFEMLLRRDETFFLVAESRRLVVGDLVGDLSLSKAKRLARLDSIAVDPEWGARRIGSRLARRFLAHAHRLGPDPSFGLGVRAVRGTVRGGRVCDLRAPRRRGLDKET